MSESSVNYRRTVLLGANLVKWFKYYSIESFVIDFDNYVNDYYINTLSIYNEKDKKEHSFLITMPELRKLAVENVVFAIKNSKYNQMLIHLNPFRNTKLTLLNPYKLYDLLQSSKVIADILYSYVEISDFDINAQNSKYAIVDYAYEAMSYWACTVNLQNNPIINKLQNHDPKLTNQEISEFDYPSYTEMW